MSPPLKVAHIIASTAIGWGGPSRVIREMTAALADRGHALTVFSTDAAPGGSREPLPAQAPFDPRVTVRVLRSDWPRPPYPSAALVAALLRELPAFDLAHVHGLFNAPCTSALLALRALGLPFVLRPCGMLDGWSMGQRARTKALWWRLLDRTSARAAAAIQCSTAHEVEAVSALLPDLARRGRVVECAQGVSPLPCPADSKAPHPARPTVLFLGRVAEKKGLLTLIRAMASLPALDLRIVGPDERGHAATLQAEIDHLGLGERVSLAGPIYDPAEKARLYAGAAAFALPSFDENFGVSLVEAAQFGAPLLVSPEVGLAPAVTRHAAGLVVPATPEAVAEGLRRLTGPEGETFSAGARALSAAYTWPERAAALEAIYLKVLEAR